MKTYVSTITADQFRARYNYDSETGILIRKDNGRVITNRTLCMFGERHETSRFIWLHYYGEWPPLDKLVDHKDRNHSNQKLSNLRLASYSENGYNMARINHNGFKGIYNCGRRSKPWQAQIRINGNKVNLGRFATKEEAAEAYRSAAIEHHGEFATWTTRQFPPG